MVARRTVTRRGMKDFCIEKAIVEMVNNSGTT